MTRQRISQTFSNRRRSALRSDAGVTLADILVGMVITALLVVVGLALFRQTATVDGDVRSGTKAWGQIQDTSSALLRDVQDGVSIRTADATEFAVTVVRDGTCRLRTWVIEDGDLIEREAFYEREACTGPTEERERTAIRGATGTEFSYETETSYRLPTPVEDLRSVRLVRWDLHAAYGYEETPPKTLASAAAFDGIGERTGTGQEQLRGVAPLLTVVTPTVGVDAPSLEWTDRSPTTTATWTVFRTSGPEGGSMGATQPVATLGGEVTTWTDEHLPAGHTAVYSIRATLRDGTAGPGSNSVVTGLRPGSVTGVTATGQPTTIRVTWDATEGATGYDVYRDGVLVGRVGATTTWTDGPGEHGWTGAGYGHSHNYRVVAVNRWEQKHTTTSESGRVALGASAGATYGGGHPRVIAAATAASGAFTAPAAPTITATPNTNYSTTIGRTFASWTGAGPTTKSGVSRDRGWEVQRAPLNGGWADLWAGTGEVPGTTASKAHTGRTPGATDQYRARGCNAAGCGPWSATRSALQRPPTPTSCTVDQATTRSARVTINRPTMESTYTSYDIANAHADATNRGTGTTYQRTIDRLPHDRLHTFTVRTRNASSANSGWSDTTTCTGRTLVLGASTPSWSSTTRSITASFSATHGSTRSLTLAGVGTSSGTSGSWDRLTDGTTFTITARNSDGYNAVASTARASTQVLPTPPRPATPSCSYAATDLEAPGSLTVTAVSGDARYRLGSGSWGATRSWGSLGPGSYRASVIRLGTVNSDGYNSRRGPDSVVAYCGYVTVADPYPTPWGGSAPGCPVVMVAPHATSPMTWDMRRSSAVTCQTRWTVTTYGADYVESFPGDVLAIGTYTIGSGATAYSGPAGYPWGPLYWG